jgi:starch synthase
MISRLDAQKGLDILIDIIDDIMALNVGLVLLGSGDADIQAGIKKAADRHQGKIGLYLGHHESLAHRIMAGADIFLIPSRYEPCGLTQMYALKYGTIPVVRATGGLNDTITPFDEKKREGNGFTFGPFHSGAFLKAINRAVSLFHDSKMWKTLIYNGMKADFSWDRSAEKYVEIYRSVLKNRKME